MVSTRYVEFDNVCINYSQLCVGTWRANAQQRSVQPRRPTQWWLWEEYLNYGQDTSPTFISLLPPVLQGIIYFLKAKLFLNFCFSIRPSIADGSNYEPCNVRIVLDVSLVVVSFMFIKQLHAIKWMDIKVRKRDIFIFL